MKHYKRIIVYDILLFALLLTSPAMVKAQTVAEQSSNIVAEKSESRRDNRIEKLKKYLEEHNSPAAEFAEIFVKKADEYGFSDQWSMVAAIFGVESTFGQHIPSGSYNGWGWGIPTGASYGIGFKNWQDGIETVTKGLKENYINKGLDTVEKIQPVYAPPSHTWANNVRFFMNEIEKVSVKPELSL